MQGGFCNKTLPEFFVEDILSTKLNGAASPGVKNARERIGLFEEVRSLTKDDLQIDEKISDLIIRLYDNAKFLLTPRDTAENKKQIMDNVVADLYRIQPNHIGEILRDEVKATVHSKRGVVPDLALV